MREAIMLYLLRGTFWGKNLRLFRALITLYLFKNL